MCLITLSKYPTRIKKDMIVYKAISQPRYVPRKQVKSLLQDFLYEEGVLYKTKMKIEDILPACRSFSASYDDEADQKLLKYLEVKQLPSSIIVRVISEGFHSAVSPERLQGGWIRRFLIPKGSYIYRDKSGLIVSNQIKLLPEFETVE